MLRCTTQKLYQFSTRLLQMKYARNNPYIALCISKNDRIQDLACMHDALHKSLLSYCGQELIINTVHGSEMLKQEATEEAKLYCSRRCSPTILYIVCHFNGAVLRTYLLAPGVACTDVKSEFTTLEVVASGNQNHGGPCNESSGVILSSPI